MSGVLELIAALLWLILGIVTARRFSRLDKRMDDLLTECEESAHKLYEENTVTGETSDGYHSFNELYHHRAILFSVICAAFPRLAWKSKQHSDGTMYEGMFIVGIKTPDGPATYHYDLDYWDMFDVEELERAPEWDGHTPEDAIARIATLTTLCEKLHKEESDNG